MDGIPIIRRLWMQMGRCSDYELPVPMRGRCFLVVLQTPFFIDLTAVYFTPIYFILALIP